MTDSIILSARDLTKEFKGFFAVEGVDLSVRRGTIHALIGPNGAGKTTCFNLLTKFLSPSRGTDHLQGRGHHLDVAGRHRAAGPRALVPDFGGVPAPDGAGERAHRAAAPARRQLRFLALRESCCPTMTTERSSFWPMSACRSSPTRSPANSPTAASARWRSRRRWRSIPKCCFSTSRWPAWRHEDIERISALIKRISANRTILMVEHNLSVVADPVGHDHGSGARQGARRRRLRHRLQGPARDRSLYRSRPWLMQLLPPSRRRSRRPRRFSTVRDLERLVWRKPCPARRHFRRQAGRGRDAAGPQRRRQDHDAEGDHGHPAQAHRLGDCSRARRRSGCRRARSRAPASPTAPRSAASSPASRSRRT